MYAFGVLLWELWCSAGAWSGMSQAQVIAAILVRGRKLDFPPDTPEDYKARALSLRTLCAMSKSHSLLTALHGVVSPDAAAACQGAEATAIRTLAAILHSNMLARRGHCPSC